MKIKPLTTELPAIFSNSSSRIDWLNHLSLQQMVSRAHVLNQLITLLVLLITLPACSPAASGDFTHPTQKPYVINNTVYYPIPSSYGFTQSGTASWYGKDFHGRKTSNGETYNMYEMTAAHKTLPMNTILLVKNIENNREIVTRVNDRGPFVRGRIIDLSYSAAHDLDIVGQGTARVHITALGDAKKGNRELKIMAKNFYVGEFYVQIGSFTDRNNARRLQQRFSQAGHTTLIQKYYDQHKTYHRVHVYVGTTLQGAHQQRNVLESRGYKNAFVIAR